MTENRDDVKTIDYVLEGLPFNESSASALATPSTLDYVAEGLPFNGNPAPNGLQLVEPDDSVDVIESATILGIVEIDDETDVLDETDLLFIVEPDDEADVLDELLVMGPPISPSDDTDVAEEMILAITAHADDETDVLDELEVFAVISPDDETDLLDETSILIPFQFDDSLNIVDEINAGALIQADDEMAVVDSMSYRLQYQTSFGLQVQVKAYKETSFSLEVASKAYNPPPENSLTDPANGFTPTVILDGVTVVTNPSTAPGTLPSGVDSFIGFDISNIISGLPSCDLQDYNVNLQFGGGTFSILHSGAQSFTKGQEVVICGLKGIVTEEGPVSSPKLKGREVSGIIGDQRTLNQQLLLVVQHNDPVLNLVPRTSFVGQPPSIQWQTVQTAAMAIANNSGLALQWDIKDVALMDTFVESGMKVGDAIRSLASRLGGIFTWDGLGGWIVIDPVQGFGGWTGFTETGCLTIKSARKKSFLDLENANIVYLPVNATYGTNVFFDAPTALQPPPKPIVNHIYSTRSKFKNDSNGDPIAVYADVPGDFNELLHATTTQSRLQIVVGPDDTDKANTVTPSTSSEWFTVHVPVETMEYGKKRFKLTGDLLPDGLTNGKFQAVFGYVPDTSAKDGAFAQAVREQVERLKLLQQSQLERIRYFEESATVIEGTFMGSVPIPGNKTGGTYDTVSWEGIVTSAQISYPRNMSVRVGKFIELNLATAKSTLDSFLVNGGF